jgi:2-oxoglutarate dehydrogenase E1 component
MDFGINQSVVEELYLRYRDNPRAVDQQWRDFFDNLADPEREQLMRNEPARVVGETLVGMPAPVEARAALNSTAQSTGNGNGNGRNSQVNGAYAHGNGNGNGNGHHAAMYDRPSMVEDVFGGAAALMPPAVASTSMTPAYDQQALSQYQERVTALVQGYRMRGHRFAQLDPLGLMETDASELSLERFGLADVDPDTVFATGNFGGRAFMPLKEIVRRLKETYTRTIGVEFRNIEEPEIRAWLQDQMEPTANRLSLTHDQQVRILSKLIDAEIFEQFLHTKYVGAKRFSLEGAESLIPTLELMIDAAGREGVEEIVIGMAHRGRLNVLANVMEKSLKEIFAHFEDEQPERTLGKGDVKYHLGYSSDRITPSGHPMHLTLAFNPSHLEWVNPVVEGRVRAKQDRRGDRERKKVLPLLIHGDAAVIGQGVVQETINLSGLRGYSTGGTVHVVVNNQIGFTTVWQDSRSTRYCTDIFRMLRCPIFHVNGEDPEAVAQTVKIAMEYRQKYSRDVVIDIYCYRRYGHNEADEPRFTQPMMYRAIDQKPSTREVYVRKLAEYGTFTANQAKEIEQTRQAFLESELEATRDQHLVPPSYSMQGLWAGYRGGKEGLVEDVDTSVPIERLRDLMTRAGRTPDDFTVHPKLERLLETRNEMRDGKKPLDWGAAEIVAYASLVTENVPVRLSGQDSRRGTFSHRHAALHDVVTGRLYTPLAFVNEKQARFEVWDSPLSEAGVLGFEFGYSQDMPDGLVLWEAQFGDFCNTAQVIIDQFLCSSEDKWHRLSGLVCLLPHGMEGQGPEHSSARLERWLTLAAEDNMQVMNLTTPAQFFHALRRQALRNYRKPMIVMSPKSLLRLPAASSPLEELATGKFQRVIPDTTVDAKKVNKVIFCAGKVYYDLIAARRERKIESIAIVRIEQLYPLRAEDLRAVLEPYADGVPVVWVQEEPFNMGAWYYMRARLPEMLEGRPLSYVSRPESASPATGSLGAHKIEQARLIDQALQ